MTVSQRYGIVYRAFDSTNGKSYVGQTCGDLEKRIDSHLRSGSTCRKFKHALRKRPEKFSWSILTECLNQDDLNAAEKYWCDFFDCINDGYNLREGGGSRGRLSEETRRKMSLSRLGKPLSESHRRNVSLGSKGKTMSVEARLKIQRAVNLWHSDPENRKRNSLSHLGKRHSPDTLKKMSASQKRRRELERVNRESQS